MMPVHQPERVAPASHFLFLGNEKAEGSSFFFFCTKKKVPHQPESRKEHKDRGRRIEGRKAKGEQKQGRFSLSPWPRLVHRGWWKQRDYQHKAGRGAASCLGDGRTAGRQRWSESSKNTDRLID